MDKNPDAPPAYSGPPQPQYAPQHYPPQSQYPQQQYSPPQQEYQPQQYPPQQYPQQQYPPQQYPQQPIQQQPQVVVVTSAPVKFHRQPVATNCPHCHANITTTTHDKVGVAPWLICAGLFLLGFWLCCFIPFCIRDLKDVQHRCPNCQKTVGMYKLI